MLFAVILGFVVFVVLLAGRGIWKDVLRTQRRKHAISAAASSLPRSEQIDWFNRVGRYTAPGAVPRNLELEFMTPDEISRLIERTGEFGE